MSILLECLPRDNVRFVADAHRRRGWRGAVLAGSCRPAKSRSGVEHAITGAGRGGWRRLCRRGHPYGLAKRGWTDVALLERTQLDRRLDLACRPALVPSYARNLNVGRMINKTIEIYEGLEAETGQAVGWHKCGQLRIANTRDRLDEYRSYMSIAEVQGIRARLVSPAEARELWPLLNNRGCWARSIIPMTATSRRPT